MPYALNTVSGSFFHCTDISVTIFLYARHDDDAYNHSPLIPLFSHHRTRPLSRDSNVFQAASSLVEDGIVCVSINYRVISFLSLSSLMCIIVVSSDSSSRNLRSWNCCPKMSLSSLVFSSSPRPRRSHLWNCCLKTAPHPTARAVYILYIVSLRHSTSLD